MKKLYVIVVILFCIYSKVEAAPSLAADNITETAPAVSGDMVQHIGFALSDDEAYFNFAGHWLIVE